MAFAARYLSMRPATVVLFLAAIIAVAGIVWWINPNLRWPAIIAVLGAVAIAAAVTMLHPTAPRRLRESDRIEDLDAARRSELVRGTSLHLRDMRYRYSVRPDRSDRDGRGSFTADINTIRLGFLPVVITDNATDEQGYGYVAFVFDGQRWRGPGLPCPSGREAAIAHARRCVSPLDENAPST